jgi:hypothetical protein
MLEKESMMILAQIDLPPTTVDYFVIASVLLAIIGTLFLAYDLLGRENGPLRWFTLVITCGLVSGLVLGTTGTLLQRVFNNGIDLIWTLRFLVLGGIMGFFTVILVELPPSKTRPPIFSRTGSLIGLALGLMFALVIIYILGGPPEAALALGVPCAVIVSTWQHLTWEPSQAVSNPRGVWQFVAWEESSPSNPNPQGTWKFVDWEPPHPRPHLFSRKGFWNGFVAGFVIWLIFLVVENSLLQRYSGPGAGFEAMLTLFVFILDAGVLALATAAAGSIAQYTLWRANSLPHRTLGAFGLVLLLVAFVLQGVQPMVNILNIK